MVRNKVFLLLCVTAMIGLGGCSRQQSDWEKTRTANTTDAYELFLKKYPSGEFSAQAQARAKELYEEREWQKARDADTVEAYQAFLKQYPEGKWAEEARIRVENFTLASAPSSTTPAAPDTTAPAAPAAPTPTHKPTPPAAARAASSPPPGPSAAHAAAAAAGAYGIQLGAFKSGSDAANKHWALLEQKYPSALSGLSPTVSPRKSASGTLYRLQVANLSEKRALSICQALKGHSQACVVLHPAL